MSKESFNEHLSKSLGHIDEKYTDEALNVLNSNYFKKKKTQKQLLFLVATMLVVRGIAKHYDFSDFHLQKK